MCGRGQGIVPCGTTGESPTLSEEEHFKVIETVVKKAAGRIQAVSYTHLTLPTTPYV